MSTTKEVYAGKYLRVWMPTATIVDQDCRICPKCKKKLGYKYCPLCGTETEATERQTCEDIHDIMKKIFDDYDQFMTVSFWYEVRPDYTIVLPNSNLDCGELLDEEDEAEFSDQELTGDWIKLMEELDKRNIRYEIHNGAVSFFM